MIILLNKLDISWFFFSFRMIDVSSEWRNFGSESDGKCMDRVGAAENSLYDHAKFETLISKGTGAGAVDEFGKQKYGNSSNQVLFLINEKK